MPDTWITPRIWVAGEKYTASKANDISNNFRSLFPYTAGGDLAYRDPAGAYLSRLAIAANGYYVESDGTKPAYIQMVRYYPILLNTTVSLVAGDDAVRFRIPAALNGQNIVSVAASRKSGTGVLTLQLRNVTDGVDVLTTKLTVDNGETDSLTATTPAVIDTTHDDVATGDQFAWDVDVAGSSTLYAFAEVGFAKP